MSAVGTRDDIIRAASAVPGVTAVDVTSTGACAVLVLYEGTASPSTVRAAVEDHIVAGVRLEVGVRQNRALDELAQMTQGMGGYPELTATWVPHRAIGESDEDFRARVKASLRDPAQVFSPESMMPDPVVTREMSTSVSEHGITKVAVHRHHCARCKVEFGGAPSKAELEAHRERCFIIGDYVRWENPEATNGATWIEGELLQMNTYPDYPNVIARILIFSGPGWQTGKETAVGVDGAITIRRIERPKAELTATSILVSIWPGVLKLEASGMTFHERDGCQQLMFDARVSHLHLGLLRGVQAEFSDIVVDAGPRFCGPARIEHLRRGGGTQRDGWDVQIVFKALTPKTLLRTDGCQMMVGGSRPGDATPCGATPTVGGNAYNRYCAKHSGQVVSAESKSFAYDDPSTDAERSAAIQRMRSNARAMKAEGMRQPPDLNADGVVQPVHAVFKSQCARCSVTLDVDDDGSNLAIEVAAHADQCFVVGDHVRWENPSGDWIEGDLTATSQVGGELVCAVMVSKARFYPPGTECCFSIGGEWTKHCTMRRIPRPLTVTVPQTPEQVRHEMKVRGYDSEQRPLYTNHIGIVNKPPNPEYTVRVDPLDVEIDGWSLRTLLAIDEEYRQDCGLSTYPPSRFTPAQRAAVSAHWSAEFKWASVDPSPEAERWRAERAAEKRERERQQVTLDTEDM